MTKSEANMHIKSATRKEDYHFITIYDMHSLIITTYNLLQRQKVTS